MRDDRSVGVQPIAYAALENLAQTRAVLLVGQRRRGHRRWKPVPPLVHAARVGDQDVPRTNAGDIPEERPTEIARPSQRPVQQAPRVQVIEGWFTQCEHLANIRGHHEPVRQCLEIQRPQPQLVARGEQRSRRLVPGGEGEVTDEVRGRVLSPPQKGAARELQVRTVPLGLRHAELGRELRPVVEPNVAREQHARDRIPGRRRAVVTTAHHPAAERRRRARTGRLADAVGRRQRKAVQQPPRP